MFMGVDKGITNTGAMLDIVNTDRRPKYGVWMEMLLQGPRSLSCILMIL